MFLGLDLGTTNVKVVVADDRGKHLARASAPVRLISGSGGAVEQEIEEIWQATVDATRKATASVDGSAIQSIGVSSQGGAMQILDPSGSPVGRVISWLDQRGKAQDEKLTNELGREWFLKRIIHGGSWLAIGQIRRLQEESPDLFSRGCWVGFVGDIIVSRLCGNPAHDGTSAGLTLLYNPRLRTYDPDLLKHLGISPTQLPSLLQPQTAAGASSSQAAKALGLRAGIPVGPAVHDQYASALATGAVTPGTVMVGTGTAWVLLAVTDRVPTPATDHAFICHHVVDDLWGQIISMVNGGSALTWALELTGGTEKVEIESLLGAAAAGSDRVAFWPFLTPFGAARLAPGTRGRFSGLQLSHKRHHVVRAVVEGLAFELKRHLDLLERSGERVQQLVVGGGAAGSRISSQLLADVTGLPLRCFAGGDASLHGAAILARALLEPQTPLGELARSMLPESREVCPGAEANFYSRAYQAYLAELPMANAAQA